MRSSAARLRCVDALSCGAGESGFSTALCHSETAMAVRLPSDNAVVGPATVGLASQFIRPGERRPAQRTGAVLDLPRSFTIRESSHRIINPLTSEKLATLGVAVGLRTAMSVLDLCCGKGEMLST